MTMKELIERWKAKMPKFWAKTMKVALSIGGSGAAILVANATLQMHIHEVFLQVVSYVVCACAAIAGTAKFTKDDKEVVVKNKEA
jgi:hypothetical protein